MKTDAERVTAEEIAGQTAWLGRLARALVGADAAADAVQDVYVAALESPPRRGGSLRGWLRTVLTNGLAMRFRSERRRQAREERLTDEEAPLPTTEELLAQHETRRIVAEAIAALDEPYRTTILLCYGEGLAPSEVARRQEIPPGTVRWRLKRALELLRERLDGRYSGDRKAWAILVGRLRGRDHRSITVSAPRHRFLALSTGLLIAVAVVSWIRWRPTTGTRAAGSSEVTGPTTPSSHPPGPPRFLVPSEPADGVVAMRGTVRDSRGNPIAGGSVGVFRRRELEDYTKAQRRGFEVMRPMDVATTGTDGRYLTAPLAPGPYGATAMAPGLQPEHRGSLELRSNAVMVVDFVLADGAVKVAGVVRDAAHAPIAGARVTATTEVPRSPYFDSTNMLAAVTDAQGRYELSILPATTLMSISAEGYGSRVVVLDAQQGTDLSQDVELAPGVRLEGRVVMQGSGQAVPSAELRFLASDGLRTGPPVLVASGEDGRFEARLVPGLYAITGVMGRSIVRIGQRLTVDGSTTSVTARIEMTQGRSLAGRVVDAGGRAAPRAEVVLVREGAPPFDERQTWSSADGAFRLDGLSSGRYQVSARIVGSTEARANVDVAEGDLEGVVLTVGPGVVVSGRVLGPDGSGASNANVVVWNFGGGKNYPPQRVATGTDGRFVVDSLKGGFVRLVAESARFGVGFVDRTAVSESNATEVTLSLGSGSSVSGRVLDSTGAPVFGVNVRAFQGHEGMPLIRTVQTDADGKFTVQHLIPGPIYLVASAGRFDSAPWRSPVAPGRVQGIIVAGRHHRGIELRLPR